MRITRKIEFDAGHRVYGHEGKCAHLHGHRYVAEITVQAEELDGIGRVIDFGAVKKVMKEWIDMCWDHNTLLNADDPLACDEEMWLERNGRRPWRKKSRFFFYPRTQETIRTFFWKFGLGPAERKRPSSLPTYFVCMPNSPR